MFTRRKVAALASATLITVSGFTATTAAPAHAATSFHGQTAWEFINRADGNCVTVNSDPSYREQFLGVSPCNKVSPGRRLWVLVHCGGGYCFENVGTREWVGLSTAMTPVAHNLRSISIGHIRGGYVYMYMLMGGMREYLTSHPDGHANQISLIDADRVKTYTNNVLWIMQKVTL